MKIQKNGGLTISLSGLKFAISTFYTRLAKDSEVLGDTGDNDQREWTL